MSRICSVVYVIVSGLRNVRDLLDSLIDERTTRDFLDHSFVDENVSVGGIIDYVASIHGVVDYVASVHGIVDYVAPREIGVIESLAQIGSVLDDAMVDVVSILDGTMIDVV